MSVCLAEYLKENRCQTFIIFSVHAFYTAAVLVLLEQYCGSYYVTYLQLLGEVIIIFTWLGISGTKGGSTD